MFFLYRNNGELYDGNENLPVYDWSPKNKTSAGILDILLKPSHDDFTCKAVPHNISHNVCFLVDTSVLDSPNDWKCDDMGAWRNNRVQREVLTQQVVEVDDECEKSYQLKRIYYVNNSSKDVTKIVSCLEGKYQKWKTIRKITTTAFIFFSIL